MSIPTGDPNRVRPSKIRAGQSGAPNGQESIRPTGYSARHDRNPHTPVAPIFSGSPDDGDVGADAANDGHRPDTNVSLSEEEDRESISVPDREPVLEPVQVRQLLAGV